MSYYFQKFEKEKNWGHRLRFGDKIFEKTTLILQNRSSLFDMAPMSVSLKILQMNP